MTGAIEFMRHWRQCCKDEENCKGCFIEQECQALVDKRSDESIRRLVEKIEKRYARRYENGEF